MSRQTPSQTIGPYFAYGLVPEQYGFDLKSAFPMRLIESDDPAPRVTLTGRVLDGDGVPVHDALIEFWLARGEVPPAVCRIGTGTDPQCRYSVDLPRPQAAGNEAPHVDVIVMARGMLLHAITRIYLDDEAQANAADATLEAVPAARRHTLIARATGHGHYQFDIRLQGENETVFFEL
jgi:protocatechuate 3,4-dioxygenase alpha subunit